MGQPAQLYAIQPGELPLGRAIIIMEMVEVIAARECVMDQVIVNML